MSDKVGADGYIALGGGDVDDTDPAFYLSTILAVLDDEDGHLTALQWAEAEMIRRIRARFEEPTP